MNIYSYENKSVTNFENSLKTSIHEWRQTGVRGLWFHVADDETVWIKDLLANGFKFHHAKNKTAVLTKSGFTKNNFFTFLKRTKNSIENNYCQSYLSGHFSVFFVFLGEKLCIFSNLKIFV
jgi:hypothetical protein